MTSAPRLPGGAFSVLREFQKSPLSILQRAAAVGDVVELPLGPIKGFFIQHPDGIKRVLQENHRAYGRYEAAFKLFRQVSGLNVFTSDGDYWLKQRRLLQPAFHRQRLSELFARMTEDVEQRLDASGVQSDQPIEVEALLRSLTLGVAGSSLFSIDLSRDGRAFTEAFRVANEHVTFQFTHPLYPPPWVPTPRNRRFRAAVSTMHGMVDGIIRERKQQERPPADLLSMMLAVRYEDTGAGMTDLQLRDESMAMLLAGHDTTSLSLSWALHLIAQHAPLQERLREEISSAVGAGRIGFEQLPRLALLRRTIDESMRLYPAVYVMVRQAIADDEVMGVRIPKGALVQLSPYTTQRDARFWPEPDRFDVDRWLPEKLESRPRHAYFPFGHGPRQCIGRDFALMEMPLVLACILRRWRIVPTERTPEIQALTSLGTREGMWLRFM
jgi:cytochrome P450